MITKKMVNQAMDMAISEQRELAKRVMKGYMKAHKKAKDDFEANCQCGDCARKRKND